MPFAGYKNFQSCIDKNRDKKDPKAYCATIMRAVEGKHSKGQRKMADKMGVKL